MRQESDFALATKSDTLLSSNCCASAPRHVKNELTNTQIATYGKNNIAAMPVDIRWWPHDATPEWSQNATIAESPERFALHHDD